MKKGLALSLALITLSLTAFGQSADKIGSLYEKLTWRTVGPAVMGGRTVDIEAVESKPWIIFAAVGPSGVWKSVNNGLTWEPCFWKEATVSVGDLAVSQSNPDIVWVGSGEATCRNSVTIGDGVYKSTDGGKTWTNMGLKETRHISRVIINRGDPNIVYVAAMGHLWGPNEERGVYKTIDGGKTWAKVLYVDKNTGFADLAMDPSDSLTLYAAAYDHRRLPHYFSSGGPGSALYKTTDGGLTWKKLVKDLPSGTLGRIGIDIARSNPNVVYALIEHIDGGIWRSEDKGESWKRTCDNTTYKQVNFRPFYYSQIRVDPSDDKVVYVFSGGSYVSENMGKSFKTISMGTHPDHHALWIDPSNPMHLIDGNDGGIDITYDRGKNWYDVQNLSSAEVYQLGIDMRQPYYVYCGLQDNSVWGGPSATLDGAGILNSDWSTINGGDGFYVQPDPSDPMTVFSNSQMNGLARSDLRVLRNKSIRPEAPFSQPPYRFNWNSPILISPHDPKTVYTGGNFLFKTEDGGQSWTIISPDLSTNDPKKLVESGGPITPDNTGAEIHCTITTIAESPVAKGVIWCGTDDGNLQLTQDGGKTWTNMVKDIRGLPPATWCNRVEASHFEAGTAYAAFDGHQTDDYGTYVYKTTDFGKTWTSLRGNLPFGWAHVIREDSKNKNLLFVGLEFGIYASLDAGKSWFSLRNNLPTSAVHDILVHPRDRDLIIGTHGAGIWILDDISPLEEMNDQVLASDVYLFSVRPSFEFLMSTRGESYTKPVYSGANPGYGMPLTVYFKTAPKEKPTLHIKDSKGEDVFLISLFTKEGIQRNLWNLQFTPKNEKGEKLAITGFSLASLPFVSPGAYAAQLEAGTLKAAQPAQVLADPRLDWPEPVREAQNQAIAKLMGLSKTMGTAVTAVASIRRDLDPLNQDLSARKDIPADVTAAMKSFTDKFAALEEAIKPKEFGYRGSREMALRGGSLSQLLMMLGLSLGNFPGAPSQTELARMGDMTAAINDLLARLNAFISGDIPALNAKLEASKLKTLKAPNKVE